MCTYVWNDPLLTISHLEAGQREELSLSLTCFNWLMQLKISESKNNKNLDKLSMASRYCHFMSKKSSDWNMILDNCSPFALQSTPNIVKHEQTQACKDNYYKLQSHHKILKYSNHHHYVIIGNWYSTKSGSTWPFT